MKYAKTWYSYSKKIKDSKDEIEEMIWLWIIGSGGFKTKKKDFALRPNSLSNLL